MKSWIGMSLAAAMSLVACGATRAGAGFEGAGRTVSSNGDDYARDEQARDLETASAQSNERRDAPNRGFYDTDRDPRCDWDPHRCEHYVADRPTSAPPASYNRQPVYAGAYQVSVVGADGRSLPLFFQGGRNYVLGAIGERYRVRIVNPTARRVEAVVSVDGLDAIDGRPAGYEKRGYVIAAYGEVSVEGFRTSLSNVAAFRFSSVRDSYAARKGADRNVGVIGVAFFPERIRQPQPRRPPITMRRDDEGESPSAERASRTPGATAPAPHGASPRDASGASESAAAPAHARKSAPAQRAERPGLGTEFGERRVSQVDYTDFQREDSLSPAIVSAIRYNDREGLLALGLPVHDEPKASADSRFRESADPFPARRFAEPPPAR